MSPMKRMFMGRSALPGGVRARRREQDGGAEGRGNAGTVVSPKAPTCSDCLFGHAWYDRKHDRRGFRRGHSGEVRSGFSPTAAPALPDQTLDGAFLPMNSDLIRQLHQQFEGIVRIEQEGLEFWLARDLMPALGYLRWENF